MGKLILDSRVNTQARDFDSTVTAFIEYAQANYTDIWTDMNPGSFARMFAELLAYENDLISFYLDRLTMENFLPTARLRQSVIDIGKMLDYRLFSGVPATGAITLTIDNATFDYGTPIPKGFRVGNGVLTFETAVETLVTAAATSVTINAIEGETKNETVIGSGALGVSDGSPNQKFTLDQKNVILSNNLIGIQDDLLVTVDNVPYSVVFNIVSAQSSEKVFVVETNDKDETSIVFGNGILGFIPPLLANIEATYRFLLTQRVENNFGNVNAGAITTLIDSIDGVVSVTNSAAFSNGRDRESIEEAKVNIPNSVKSGDRAVSDSDIKSLAEAFPGVAKAIALKSSDPLNVDLYIAPEGGGIPSQQLKNEVVTYFQPRKMIRTKIFVRDPNYQPVSINLRIQIEPNNRNADVEAALRSAINDLFDFDNMQFGRAVYLKSTGGSDIYDLNETIESVNGIANVKYNKVSLKPMVYNKKFNNIGTPEFFGGGSKIRNNSFRREFEVILKSTTEFLLKSKEFGLSTSLNDTRLEDNLKNWLLDLGSSTSTASTTLVDDDQFWVIDAYANQTLIDSAGSFFKITSNTETVLTLATGTPAGGDYQIVKRLVGYYLNPDVDQNIEFKILSNDVNSVTVASGLADISVIGDSYEIYRYETNKYDTDAHSGSETSGSATSTTFADTTAASQSNDFFNDMYVIFQDGPAANIPVKVLDFVQSGGVFTVQTLGTGNAPLSGNKYVVAPAYRLGLKTEVSLTPAPSATAFSGDLLGTEGDDFYNGYTAYFSSGTLAGEARKVTDYSDSVNDTLTTHPFTAAPLSGDEFQLVQEYQLDDKSATFGVLSTDPGSTDIYLFQLSDLIGDLTPKRNQILTLEADDLVLNIVGGSGN